MEIGKVYINGTYLNIPLTLPDIDGNYMVLEVDTQYFYNAPSDIRTTDKANAYLESKVALFPAYRYTNTTQSVIDKYISTYVPKSVAALGEGDTFLEAKGKIQYQVIGFFQREVATDPIKANAPKVKRRYPFGINLKPLMQYIERVQESKEGLAGLFENGNVWKGSELTTVLALIYKNTKLTYWSVDAPKPSDVAFIKQEKPKEKLPELKIQQPMAVGDRQTTALPLFAFGDRDNAYQSSEFQMGHGLTKEAVQELTLEIQNLNYVSPQVPKMPKTGNIFLDEFYFAFVDYKAMSKNINMGGFIHNISNNFRLCCKSKTPSAIHENYGFHIDFQNLYKGDCYEIDLNDVYFEHDYARLYAVNDAFDGEGNTRAFKTTVERSLEVNSIATFPPIYYVGQGRFSCLQGNDPNDPNDKYGVGDTFTVNNPKGSFDAVMIYMYYAHNKKGEKVKMGVFAKISNLEGVFAKNMTDIYIVHSEMGILDKVASNHKTYFDYRKKLKDFYLAGQANTASTSVSVSPYQELKDILGEEYDDAFLNAVQGLDWVKISQLQKETPEIIEPIKELIRQAYVRYVIEKAKNPQAMKSASTGRKDGAKYYIKIPANSNVIESAEYVNQVLGADFTRQASFWAAKEPKPEMSLQDIPKLVSKAMGSFDIKWTNNTFDFTQILTFQENKEPLLIQDFKSFGDGNDGEFKVSYNQADYDNFLTYRSQGRTNNHWRADADYYHMYGGFKIMYMLWRVSRINTEPKDVEIKPSNHKKIAPMVLSDVGINYLRYMNRWGFFATPEEIHDAVKKQWNDSTDYNYPTNLGAYSTWMFTTTNANRTEDLLAKQRLLHLALTEAQKERFNEFLNNKDGFCQYLYSLPIDWGNTEASYMEEPQVVKPSKPTRKTKKKQGKSDFAWIKEPWEDALTDNVQTEFNKAMGLKDTAKITLCSFEAGYTTPNDPAEVFYLLTFPLHSNQKYDKFTVEIYDKYARDIDTSALEVSYPILQETRSKRLQKWPMYCREADFQKLIDDITKAAYAMATPPAPPTVSFKWLQEPWNDVFKPEGLTGFIEEYGLNAESEAKLAAFEAEYPTAGGGKEEFVMIVFKYKEVDPSKRDAWMELASKMIDLSDDVEYATILNEYPQVRDALNNYNPTNYYIFREKNMYKVYAELMMRQLKQAIATKFTWIDTPWMDALRASRQVEFNSAYGLPITYSIRTCSFAAGYPTSNDPSQRFSLFAFPITANAKADELLLQLKKKYEQGKFERKYLVDYEQIRDAIKKLGNDPYDFVFCKGEDSHKLIEDILDSIQTAAPAKPAAPPAPKPPAPKPPKPPKPTTPKTPKPKKPDLSKLSNISFDDI